MEHATAKATAHVVIMSSPGVGHLIPFAELAGCLARHHQLSVTLVVHSAEDDVARSLLDSLPPGVQVLFFPVLPVEALPEGASAETRMFLSVNANLTRLRELMLSIPSLAALVVDAFGLDAFDDAAELGVPYYLFFTSPCTVLSFAFRLNELDAALEGEFRDLLEPIRLPGCVPIRGEDLVQPVHDRSSENYKQFLRLSNRTLEAKGVFVNSFTELEGGPIAALQVRDAGHPAVYPIGPLIRFVSEKPDVHHEALSWLDGQPERSVVYVSFGSGGTLTWAQLTELALGLETSGQRFLWVVKSPNEHESNATYFSVKSLKDPMAFLPDGFLERTKDRGLVIPSWAPQVKVLRHAATGGFLTHCGWNSVLEALAIGGVPLIAWPLYAEQKMNATVLVEDAKVALRPKEDAGGLIRREEVARVVRRMNEGEGGESLRLRARELGDAAARALDVGGSSYRVLSQVTEEWKARINSKAMHA